MLPQIWLAVAPPFCRACLSLFSSSGNRRRSTVVEGSGACTLRRDGTKQDEEEGKRRG